LIRRWIFAPLLMCALPSLLMAQAVREHDPDARCEVFGEYSRTSDSVTEHDSYPQPSFALNGFETGATLRVWRGLSIKGAVSRYTGSNIGAESQIFGVAGGQYAVRFGPESIFVEGLFGTGRVNAPAFYSGKGTTASTSVFGGGLDTRIVRHLAFRVEGSLLHATFVPTSDQIHGIPTSFGRFSTGLVVRF
jgi:hypothetical protein